MFNSFASLPVFHSTTLAFGLPSGGEWVILLVLGLLIFGRRLPEVGRSLGRGIVEFKKGIRGIEDEIDFESSRPTRRFDESAPRQELPRSQPMQEPQDRNPYASVQPQQRSE